MNTVQLINITVQKERKQRHTLPMVVDYQQSELKLKYPTSINIHAQKL